MTTRRYRKDTFISIFFAINCFVKNVAHGSLYPLFVGPKLGTTIHENALKYIIF